MNNISDIRSCYGCGVCALACGRKNIEIRRNADGFYEPNIIDAERCTGCGLCRDVCSYCHTETALREQPKASFAAWSKEIGVRQVSASGGVGFEIGRYLISQGYKAVAVRYNTKEVRAEHYVATTIEEFFDSMGSKYIQSYTLNALRAVDRKQRYLMTGTPCQIDSFRRFIRKFHCEDNFVLLDFFCHGVPSHWVWLKYITEQEKRLGEIDYVGWRNKLCGWHDSWTMVIDGKEQQGEAVDWHDSYNMSKKEKSFINSRASQGDSFYSLFFGNNCLGKACYKHCKFKYDHSSADIRIGDMWGDTMAADEKGVTACIAMTEKGRQVLAATNCEFSEYPFDVVAEGQIRQPMRYPLGWPLVIALAKSPRVSMRNLVLANRIVGKINRIIKKCIQR